MVHDELDFDVGVLRLKSSGGHGGHNGLRDIIASLGVKDFKRFRVGIGRGSAGRVVADYVLSYFSRADVQQIKEMFYGVIRCVPLLVAGEYDEAVHKIHSA